MRVRIVSVRWVCPSSTAAQTVQFSLELTLALPELEPHTQGGAHQEDCDGYEDPGGHADMVAL
jgi:hypothetical protein